MTYVISFGIACILSILATGAAVVFGRLFLHHHRPAEAGRARRHVSRLGGVAMIGAFVGTLFLHPDLVLDRQWLVLLGALGGVALIGVWDDLWPLSWRPQLFAQTVIALFVFVLGIRIIAFANPLGGVVTLAPPDAFPWLSLLVGTLWIVGIMNVMNWLDGVDGLGGGVALAGAAAVFATALLPHVYQPPVAIAAAALGGVTLGFLFWNWAPARITAGTSGSFFWGLLIAVLAIFAGAKVATTLMVLTVPLVDAVWVVGERLRAGASVFAADQRHLHHKLIARGWSPSGMAAAMAAGTGTLAVLSAGLSTYAKVAVILAVALVTVGVLVALGRGGQR